MKDVLLPLWREWEEGREFCAVSDPLVKELMKRSLRPRLLPITRKSDILDQALEKVSGLLLPGGEDINPFLYGKEPEKDNEGYDYERDEMERILLEKALAKRIPILAICRGMQMINVFFQGTLGSVSRETIRHESLDGRPKKNDHGLYWEQEAFRKKELGSLTRVNSFHRRAVEKPGEGIVVEARALDGTVESLRVKGHPEVLAFQFHPEFTDQNPEFEKIWDLFASLCHSAS